MRNNLETKFIPWCINLPSGFFHKLYIKPQFFNGFVLKMLRSGAAWRQTKRFNACITARTHTGTPWNLVNTPWNSGNYVWDLAITKRGFNTVDHQSSSTQCSCAALSSPPLNYLASKVCPIILYTGALKEPWVLSQKWRCGVHIQAATPSALSNCSRSVICLQVK